MTVKGIGDLVGVVGLVITVVGFAVTARAALRAKSAAELAKAAAEKTRDSITMFETIVDFSAGIATLEEIKRLHRMPDAQPLLLDRYQATRKLLIVLRHSKVNLNEEQSTVVQNALTNVAEMESQLEKNPATFKSAKNNVIVSSDIDGLLAVLTQLKAQASGAI